jgi:hypothetical protein
MSEPQEIQGEETARFQAFAQTVDPAPSRTLPVALIAIGAAVVVVLVVALIAVLR